MVDNTRIVAQLRTGVIIGLALIAVSLSARAQSPVLPSSGPGKTVSNQPVAPIGQSPSGLAFSQDPAGGQSLYLSGSFYVAADFTGGACLAAWMCVLAPGRSAGHRGVSRCGEGSPVPDTVHLFR